jgi:hypothetical protein
VVAIAGRKQNACLGSNRPNDDFERRPVELEAQPGAIHATYVSAAGAGHFQTAGASFLLCRNFTSSDGSEMYLVATVNQHFAEIFGAKRRTADHRSGGQLLFWRYFWQSASGRLKSLIW